MPKFTLMRRWKTPKARQGPKGRRGPAHVITTATGKPPRVKRHELLIKRETTRKAPLTIRKLRTSGSSGGLTKHALSVHRVRKIK